jgi:CMP-N-acetylneuraminate monooxygenase
MNVDLRNIKSFPHQVEISGSNYFIVKETDGYYLVSSICPHQGGEIIYNNGFECKVHGWKFNNSGECINVPSQKLYRKKLNVNGEITKLAEISNNFKTERTSDVDLDIKLHAHSCVEITHNGYSVLTDPWLEGLAFMGSWKHSPQPLVKAEQLDPNLIWISHEHSDHFHIETIKKFNRKTKILFPDFPNKRIEKTLIDLGFEDILPLKFGEEKSIYGFKFTCYEPQSVWNDSILHINVNNFNILNLNDAGLNFRIKKYLPKIDLLMSAFSPGASGFPLCWKNLSKKERIDYYVKAKNGMLEMLERACKLYDTDFLLPYASHFDLHIPEHSEYRALLVKHGKNTIMDVKDHIKGFEVLDILPGESWNSVSGRTYRIYNEKSKKAMYSRKMAQHKEFEKYFPAKDPDVKMGLIEYLHNLNSIPEICLCEDIRVRLNSTYFTIESGKLHVHAPISECDLAIDIPENILKSVILNNISWDEAHIGYWCTMYRKTDKFNQQFWRLLQSPYYKKKIKNRKPSDNIISESTNVLEIVNNYPNSEPILRRYGLYCFGCANAIKEDIKQAADYHGLDESSSKNLIMELNNAI